MHVPEPTTGEDVHTPRARSHAPGADQRSDARRLAQAIGRALHLQDSEVGLLVAYLQRIDRIEQEVHALRTAKAGAPGHTQPHQGPDDAWHEPHPSRESV